MEKQESCFCKFSILKKLRSIYIVLGPQNDGQTLGEILVRKSNEGVAVYVMVWSEKSSGEIVGEKGVMGTHDMETFHFFEDTKVCCALAPRELDTINELTDFLQNEFASGMYTHHQKTVILGTIDYTLWVKSFMYVIEDRSLPRHK